MRRRFVLAARLWPALVLLALAFALDGGVGTTGAATTITEIAPTATVQSETPVAINDLGVVAGDDYGYRGGTNTGPFRWSSGTYTTLGQSGTLSGGAVTDINRDGAVVGDGSNDSASAQRALLWPAGSTTPSFLPCLSCAQGLTSVANAINQAGLAVGFEEVPGSFPACGNRGYRSCSIPVEWQNGTVTQLGTQIGAAMDVTATGDVLINPDSLPDGTRSSVRVSTAGVETSIPCLYRASQLNDAGTVVGQTPGSSPAYSTRGDYGACTALPLLSGDSTGSVTAIDDSGAMVGQSGSAHAVAWGADGAITDLNSLLAPGSGWVLQRALTINANGDILGTGTLNGNPRGFVLHAGSTTTTPTTDTTTTTSTVTTTATTGTPMGPPDPCAPPAHCPPASAAIAHVLSLSGHVYVRRGTDPTLRLLRNGDPLFKSDVLVADQSSAATFSFLVGGTAYTKPGQALLLMDEATVTHPDGSPFVGKYDGPIGGFKFFLDQPHIKTQELFRYIGTPEGTMSIKG